MKKTIIALVLFISFISINTNAQTYTEGYFKFEISDFKSDDPQMQAMESMLKGTITKLYFTKENALTKINSMGGMSVIKIVVDKEGNSNMYMEMMGQKLLIKMNKDEAKELAKDKPEYIHHKDKTKEILGLKAHFVEVNSKEQGIKIEMWVTDAIDTKAMVQQGINNTDIGGFPLEYTMIMEGRLSMTTKAVKFKKDFDKSVFNFDKSGFVEKSLEDLKGMGMGGGF